MNGLRNIQAFDKVTLRKVSIQLFFGMTIFINNFKKQNKTIKKKPKTKTKIKTIMTDEYLILNDTVCFKQCFPY